MDGDDIFFTLGLAALWPVVLYCDILDLEPEWAMKTIGSYWDRAVAFNRHVWSDPINPKTNPIGFALMLGLIGAMTLPLWHHFPEQTPYPSATQCRCPCP